MQNPAVKAAYQVFQVTSSNSFEDMLDRMPIIVGSPDVGHAHFWGNFLWASSSFPIQSRVPNLKFLAQVVFDIAL